MRRAAVEVLCHRIYDLQRDGHSHVSDGHGDHHSGAHSELMLHPFAPSAGTARRPTGGLYLAAYAMHIDTVECAIRVAMRTQAANPHIHQHPGITSNAVDSLIAIPNSAPTRLQ